MGVCEATAVELAATLRRRELSASEALRSVLARVDAIAADINPFSVRLDEHAVRAAEAADAALAQGIGGPLCGVPITVKDSHWMAGVPTTNGSRAVPDFVPSETSAAVERLERAGAVIFAKSATSEFCYFGITDSPAHGRTSNPWDLDRTPGGSSGGAAAAVAARLGPLSLGGDGGGSIRIPAAFCGITGFKPTFGLVPREPCSPGWKTLVAIGPLARCISDARLMLATIAGMDPRDRHSINVAGLDEPAPSLLGLRIAVSEDLSFAAVDADVRSAFRAAMDRVVAAGAEIVEDQPGLPSSVEPWARIATAEARRAERDAFENSRGLMSDAAADFLAFGETVTAAEYIDAQMERERIHRAYVDMFERTGARVLLTPTVGCEPFRHGTGHPESIGGVRIGLPWTDWAPFIYDANLAGLPACALPIGLGDEGLPVSLQVLGPRGGDGAVLAVAEAIEQVVGFVARHPHPPGIETAVTEEVRP